MTSLREEIAKELENYYINQVIKDRNSKYNNTSITITDKDIKKILENIKNDNLMEAWVILKIIEKRIDEMIKDTYVIATQDTSTTISTVAERRALRRVKEILK